MCNNCSKVYCGTCVMRMQKLKTFISIRDIVCPCCSQMTNWVQLKFPHFFKDQIQKFEFKCKFKGCSKGPRMPNSLSRSQLFFTS
mmetsp:Transcript_17565/g.29648  ORF Transcript_17565/g.29648 Transcript_17565/m.29648 type:complete len:85 (-) Transcript_17565:524-778(-)